ncbi:MAG: F0F1 ATP synthase subunit B [Armatimonadia bacterium]
MESLGFDPRSLLVNVVGFLVLLWVFRRFLYRPVSEFMGQRTKEIEGQINEAKRLNDEAQQQHARLQEELAAQREAAREDIGRMTAEAKTAIEDLHKEARRQRQDMVEQGRLELERSKEAALEDLKRTVADLALEMSEKVIRQSLDEERQGALVDGFISDIKQAQN